MTFWSGLIVGIFLTPATATGMFIIVITIYSIHDQIKAKRDRRRKYLESVDELMEWKRGLNKENKK